MRSGRTELERMLLPLSTLVTWAVVLITSALKLGVPGLGLGA